MVINYYRTWMADNTAIHSRTLQQICLPAAHDAGAYALTDTLLPNPSPELAAVLNKLHDIANWIDEIPGIGKVMPNPPYWVTSKAIPAIRGLSTTTYRRVADQLNDGIRCLDLRICYNASDQQFYTFHGLLGSNISEILADIAAFMESTSGEIVFVTMGHWNGFAGDHYAVFSSQVKDALGQYAYVREGGDPGYTNNPFGQPYTAIIGQGGVNRSRVILVNGKSNDPVFWPQAFSPPDHPSNAVTAGAYTDTSDFGVMASDQIGKFAASKTGTLPFALYVTLTPQKRDAMEIVISSLASAIALFAAPLFLNPITLPIGVALEGIAGGLAAYSLSRPWNTLRELSQKVSGELYPTLTGQFQPADVEQNQISFIYLDFYEDTDVVGIAIQYSGGTATSFPRMLAVTGGTNFSVWNLELFGVGADGSIFHNWYGGNGWNTWTPDVWGATFDVASVTAATNQRTRNGNMEVFALDESGVLWHNYWNGAEWQPAWTQGFNMAPPNLTAVAAETNGQNRNLEVFALDAHGVLWHCYYGDADWQAWVRCFNGAPADLQSVVVHSDSWNNVHVFAIDTGGTLWHLLCYQAIWNTTWDTQFNQQPAPFASVFAVTNSVPGNGNLELFAVGQDGTLYHSWLDPNGWNGWTAGFDGAPPNVTRVVAVGNTVNNNVEVFAIDQSGTLWHDYTNGEWQGWTANFNGAPELQGLFAVNNPRNGNLEVFGVGDEGVVSHCWLTPSGWEAWVSAAQ